MHLRAQIRMEAAAIIQAAIAGLPGSVQTTRIYSLDRLPAVVVSTGNEQKDAEAGSHPVQFRELDLSVEIFAKANSLLDQVLDNLAEQVEAALAADQTLGGLCKNINLLGTSPEVDDELEKPAGVLRQSWAVLYRVDTRAPGAPVD